MNKRKLIIFTIFSTLLSIVGFFYIPILTALGVNFPERNFLWGLTIIPTVIFFSIPLIFCIIKWTTLNKNK